MQQIIFTCRGGSYRTLQIADKKAIQYLSCFVTVSDILESLGCILSANIKQNLFSTSNKESAYCINDFVRFTELLKRHKLELIHEQQCKDGPSKD